MLKQRYFAKKIEKNIVGPMLFVKMLLGAAVIPSYKARLV